MEDTKEVKVESVSINSAKKAPAQDDKKAKNESPNEPKLDDLMAELADTRDKYLRTAAELENTRRRAALDAESRARSRAMGVAEKILPVMDAVDAALKHSPEDEGIMSLARALKSSFDEIGITKIESVGQPLNPMLHNAIQVIDAPENTASGTIVEEMQSGYMFGDTVLRTAMVVVAK
jgi:molecular chaperone GrpE